MARVWIPSLLRDLTGGAHLPVPSWVAAIVDDAGAPGLCDDARSNFTGGIMPVVEPAHA